MRPIFYGAATIALAVLLLAACNSNDFQSSANANANANKPPAGLNTQTPSDGVPRITVTELKEKVDKGTAFIVDTRGPEAYAAEHIKGSINMPETSIAARSGELPRDKMIVTYCS
jgi:3-mercaptopyruvate sulfurtransferase SseA